MTFNEFFVQATGLPAPYPYQERLAANEWPDILEIPTGLGKTAAITLAWLYKRGWRGGGRFGSADPHTPRRLFWCLPMRVLVEQTEQNVRRWLASLQIDDRNGGVSAHVLMGGEEDLRGWAEFPERDTIVVGTQDMLLSRALMRGYGVSRYQWPVQFALAHNDAFWVFDEVQLMGAGLSTSAQLEAFRRRFPLGRRSRSLWASATFNPAWLATVDMASLVGGLSRAQVDEADRAVAGARLAASKQLELLPLVLSKDAGTKAGLQAYLKALSQLVLGSHEPGSQTMVIVNRVARAQGLYRLLTAARPGKNDLLVHSRFRGVERATQARRLREKDATDRIVVATQAIEAGVDVSSRTLITELAPWASMVQRAGRCNRYGEWNDTGGGRVLWIDCADDADTAPYDGEDLSAARATLRQLQSASPDALPAPGGTRSAGVVLRRKDLLDLFNTDPDLSGFDVDVADYIRDTEVPSFRVFWRELADLAATKAEAAPAPVELCPVSVSQSSSLKGRDAWHWDALDNCWTRLSRPPRPGMTVMLAARQGGYDTRLGFDPTHTSYVDVLPHPLTPAEDFGGDVHATERPAVLLEAHLRHVRDEALGLCRLLGEEEKLGPVVKAALWHDVGKAHPVFQATMHSDPGASEGLLAKSPSAGRHGRRYFRHELASMLMWLASHDGEPDADLVAYLIAAHHGRVRSSLRAMPQEQAVPGVTRFARGIWEGDVVEGFAFGDEACPTTTLSLGMMELGEGEHGASWASRALLLLEEHGPFRLAWLESLVRLADWRASAAEVELIGGGA